MKTKKSILLFAACISSMMAQAQATGASGSSSDWFRGGNTNAGSNTNNIIGTYWNAQNSQMWFTTGDAAYQYRMMIAGGGKSVNDGRAGFGNDLPGTFLPSTRLHSHLTFTTGATGVNSIRFSNSTFPNGQAGGLEIGNGNNGGGAFYTNFENNQSQAFYTNGNNVLSERLKIQNGTGHTGLTNATRVNISYGAGFSPITTPVAMLNLGFDPAISPQGGNRSWMDVGTFMALNSDHMYVGLKNETTPNIIQPGNANELTDAVICWGDNTTVGGGNFGPDYMRFIFTSPFGVAGYGPYSGTNDGLETMRMAFDGNVGIGNFYNDPNYTFTKRPARRLEVLTDRFNFPVGTGAPQFRLTFDQQNPSNQANTGKFADFYETNLGDLGISAQDNTLVNNAIKNLKERFVGINTNAPGNTLELNSQFVNSSTANSQPPSTFGNPTGWAGLRFTDLRSTSIVQANPNTTSNGVLSVDANGDVIYVPGGTSSLGNLCGSLANPLPGPGWEIPMNGNNFWFSGNGGLGSDRVSIGFPTGSCNTPGARLHVGQNSGVNNDIGILSQNNVIDGVALKVISSGGATAAETKVGGWFEASAAAGAQQVAIYVPQNQGKVNIGYPSPSSAGGVGLLNVNGNINLNGSIYLSNVWALSDQRYKKDIKKIESVSEKIKKLNGYSYHFKKEEFPNENFTSEQQLGLLAQELKEVFPQLVHEDDKGYYSVNYQGMIPVLLEGLKDQQTRLEDQQKVNQDLQQQINELKNLLASNSGEKKNPAVTSVNLSDKNIVVLNQNVPNPFAENTLITYVLPEEFNSAKIVFNTLDGKTLKTVDLTKPGYGELRVFASDISNGVYFYELIIDGKTIASKKMIKE